MYQILIFIISIGARVILVMCRYRADLVLENLALRQQVTALKSERPRPPLKDFDRAFWVALRQSWPAWASRLVITQLPAGIGDDSGDTGQRSRVGGVQGGLALTRRFVS